MKTEEGNLKTLFKIFDLENRNFDFILLGSLLVLTALGMLMVYSTSSIFSLEKYGDSSHFLKLHSIYLMLGFISLVFFMHLDYRFLRKLVYPIYIFGFIQIFHISNIISALQKTLVEIFLKYVKNSETKL